MAELKRFGHKLIEPDNDPKGNHQNDASCSARPAPQNERPRPVPIWDAFKAEFPSTALLQFETAIADIAKFEEIRYPDNVLEHGAKMQVDWGPIPAQIGASSPPLYKLYPKNLDRLVWGIFSASCRNPLFFTTRLKPDVRDMLARDNPVAAQLLGN